MAFNELPIQFVYEVMINHPLHIRKVAARRFVFEMNVTSSGFNHKLSLLCGSRHTYHTCILKPIANAIAGVSRQIAVIEVLSHSSVGALLHRHELF